MLSIGVETATGLSSEPPCCHVLPEQGTRAVLGVAKPGVQHLENRETGIKADQIGLDTCLAILEVLQDRKSTRLNSSHTVISYAVFCLKKKQHETAHGHACASRSSSTSVL